MNAAPRSAAAIRCNRLSSTVSKNWIASSPATTWPHSGRSVSPHHRCQTTSATRRAAVAYTSRRPQQVYEHASTPGDVIHVDDHYEPSLSSAQLAREDIERALHPSWDSLTLEQDREQFASSRTQGRYIDELGLNAAEAQEEVPASSPKVATKPTRARIAKVSKPAVTPPVSKLTAKTQSTSIIRPYVPPAEAPSHEPHAEPLRSRYDWRLSSPVRPRYRNAAQSSSPPSLHAPRSPSSLAKQGHNALVGIGVDPARTDWWSASMRAEESWGWKVRLPAQGQGQKDEEWMAADVWRERLDRLITLSREADEQSYIASLARLGTPAQRESLGRTVCRARGTWLTATKPAASDQADRQKAKGKQPTGGGGGGGGGAMAVAAWWDVEGRALSEEMGWKFTPGTILRFTPLNPEPEGELRGGPKAPVSATQGKNFRQGTLLEVREGQLIVGFDEKDVGPFDEMQDHRIDIGNDDTSYELQSRAIDNLFFDPVRQRQRNAAHVQAIQTAHIEGTGTPGTNIIREWTLQGTDLRQLIVPRLSQQEKDAAARAKELDPERELFENGTEGESPANELAKMQIAADALPMELLPPAPASTDTQASANPATLFADNQLINSWVKRHRRDKPMKMTGDPVLNLNESQTKAVAMALGEKLSLIQGPPGTGKSQTIVSIIALLKLHFRIPQPILLAAPTHVSVDHLLSLLIAQGLNPLRSGKADKVRPELQEWTLEKRREKHPLWNKLEATREESEENRLRLQEFRDERGADGKVVTPEVVQQELDLEAKYRKCWRRYIVLEQRLYSSLMATADVFCSTAIGSGASKVMSMIDFPIVFLDEAAMCTEPVSLIPIMKGAEHVCFIGDHKQLPAVVKSRDAVQERLHVSLFERLMAEQSVQSTLLDTQYRMRPVISAFPDYSFYHSALQDAQSVTTRGPAPLSQYLDPKAPSTFISHTCPESTFRQSTLNRGEVDIIVAVVGDLLLRNPSLDPADIGIISPYFAQTRLLQDTFDFEASRVLERLLGPERAAQVSRVEVNTVDGFQGREKDVIVLSTVRSNATGHIGFLTDQRRLNVALTRAKEALLVVGNRRTLKMATMSEWKMADQDADGGIWRRYIGWLEQRGLVREWEAAAESTEGRSGAEEKGQARQAEAVYDNRDDEGYDPDVY